MEAAIGKISGVRAATVAFMTQKLIIETDAADQSDILSEAEKIIKKIEPDCRLVR